MPVGEEEVEFDSGREDGSAVGPLGGGVPTREPVLVRPVKSEIDSESRIVR